MEHAQGSWLKSEGRICQITWIDLEGIMLSEGRPRDKDRLLGLGSPLLQFSTPRPYHV